MFRRKDNPYGDGRVMIANRSTLHWEYFVKSDDKVVNEVWLTKTTASDQFTGTGSNHFTAKNFLV